jgi:hypothetical protein
MKTVIILNNLLESSRFNLWSIERIRDSFCSFLINYGYCKQILEFDVNEITTNSEFEEFAYDVLLRTGYSSFTDILTVETFETEQFRFIEIEKVVYRD